MLKCQVCFGGKIFLAPDLRDSGYPAPKDYICPICGTFHNSHGKISNKDKITTAYQKPIDGIDTITIYQ